MGYSISGNNEMKLLKLACKYREDAVTMVTIHVRVTAAMLPPNSHRMKYTATTSTAMCHTSNPEERHIETEKLKLVANHHERMTLFEVIVILY